MARMSILLGGWSAYAGPVLALLIAAAGGFMLRRRVAWLPALSAGGAAAGWFVVAGGVPVITGLRSLQQHVVLPAVVIAVATGGGVVWPAGRRWLAVGAASFAGCWVAGSAAGRPEYWRVVFAIVGGAWLLHGVGAGRARQGLVAGLMVFGGVLAGGAAASWGSTALVLVAVAAALVYGEAVVISPVLLASGIVAIDLGAGRLVRGGIGVVDLACGLAFVTPMLVGYVDRRMGGRLGRVGRFAVPVVLACAGVGVAWVSARVMLR